MSSDSDYSSDNEYKGELYKLASSSSGVNEEKKDKKKKCRKHKHKEECELKPHKCKYDKKDSKKKKKRHSKKNMVDNYVCQSSSPLDTFNFTVQESRRVRRFQTVPAALFNNAVVGTTPLTFYVNGTLVPATPPVGGQVLVLSISFAPGAHTDWHTHLGNEQGQVVSGAFMVFIVQPNQTVRGYIRYPGETLLIPPGAVHFVLNISSGTSVIAAQRIVSLGPSSIPAAIPPAVTLGQVYEVERTDSCINTECDWNNLCVCTAPPSNDPNCCC
jgi:quercetin dioxygenase-like cupin family protein